MNGSIISFRNFIIVGLMAYVFVFLVSKTLVKFGKPQFSLGTAEGF